MRLSAYCMNCLINKQLDNIKDCKDEELKACYMRRVMEIISQSEPSASAPELHAPIDELYKEFFGAEFNYTAIKNKYNLLMLEKETDIQAKVHASEDGLREALKYSRVGNYIDFAIGNVDDEALNQRINQVHDETLDAKEYEAFTHDLASARELVLITDNSGEIVFDKVLIKYIKSMYPSLHITVIVRGKMVLNDATLEDAQMVGLTELVDVIGNGTGIPGTCLHKINEAAKRRIEAADLIISKGQGNFETLKGCGLNIYYLFLCKCDWFVTVFGMKKYTGVFVNERNL